MHALNVAVLVAGGIDGTEVDVRIEECLHIVITGSNRVQACQRERRGGPVDGRDNSRTKIPDVAAQNWRGVGACLTNSISRLGSFRVGDDDEETPRRRRKVRRDFKSEGLNARSAQPQKRQQQTKSGQCFAHFLWLIFLAVAE